MKIYRYLLLLVLLAIPAAAQFGSNSTSLRGKKLCNPLSPVAGQALSWDATNACWAANAPLSCNLAVQSETFDNASWTKAGGSPPLVTANQAVAPDGTSTADLATAQNTTSSDHIISQTVAVGAGAYTFSLYVKQAVNTKRILLREGSQTGASASFDLSTGTYLAGATGGVGTITTGASGWYRISLTVTVTAASLSWGIIFLPDTGTVYADRNYAAATGDGFYFWGASLTAGSTPASYTRTLTQAGCFVSSSSGPIPVPGTIKPSTVALLPTCNAASEGLIAGVTDATTPTFLGTLTGGSTVHSPAYCNGTAWVAF